MKTWKSAEIVELDIEETAWGGRKPGWGGCGQPNEQDNKRCSSGINCYTYPQPQPQPQQPQQKQGTDSGDGDEEGLS